VKHLYYIISTTALILCTALSIPTTNAVTIDATGKVSWIVDGDTFDINNGAHRIRPADINAPEINQTGYESSKWYLKDLIYGKTVYLDISTLNGVDEWGRLICVVYLDYNSTHYINVNKQIVESGHAIIKDYSNDFNPYTWTLYVPKTNPSPISYTLLVQSPDGSGSTYPTIGNFSYNSIAYVPVQAYPSDGWTFDHWELDGVNVGGQNPYTAIMNSNHQLRAVFTQSKTPKPAVIIDQLLVDDNRVNVGTTQSVRLHARWDNGSSVYHGVLTISENNLGSAALNEETQTSVDTYTTNLGGWITINATSSYPTKKTWKVNAVNSSGVTDFTQTAASPSIIWDRVNVMIRPVDDRINIGSNPSFEWTAFYEYDEVPFTGKVNTARMFPGKDGIGKALFTTVSIEDTTYGLTTITRNQAEIIWDRVKITQGGVSNQLTKAGNTETVWFKAVYEYDNSSFTGEPLIYGDVNKVFVNGVPMSWSSSERMWKYSTKLDDNGKLNFVTGIEDMRYKLTNFVDVAGPQSITWEKPFLETIVGLASVVIAIGIIVAGIYIIRNRKGPRLHSLILSST
jgi:micrococcal nuclease